jgi:hypothetical protein
MIPPKNQSRYFTRLSSSWGLEKVLATWSGLKIWSVLTPESAGDNITYRTFKSIATRIEIQEPNRK